MKLGFLALLGALLVLPSVALAQDGNQQTEGDEAFGAVVDPVETGVTGNQGNTTDVGNVGGGHAGAPETVGPPKGVIPCGGGEFIKECPNQF